MKRSIEKDNMVEDIVLSISCILSVIIMYPFSFASIFNTNTAVDYITYSVCVVVVAKMLFHILKFLYNKIKNNKNRKY